MQLSQEVGRLQSQVAHTSKETLRELTSFKNDSTRVRQDQVSASVVVYYGVYSAGV